MEIQTVSTATKLCETKKITAQKNYKIQKNVTDVTDGQTAPAVSESVLV